MNGINPVIIWVLLGAGVILLYAAYKNKPVKDLITGIGKP